MNSLAATAATAMAALLLWAGVEKLRDQRPAAHVLERIGVRAEASTSLVLALALVEIVAAIGLVFVPASGITIAGPLLLAGVFAVGGVAALMRTTEPVACHCLGFGVWGAGRLGWSQVWAFPAWSAGALIQLERTRGPSVEEGAALLCSIALAMAAVRAATVWRAMRAGRGDRVAAEQMFKWLRR